VGSIHEFADELCVLLIIKKGNGITIAVDNGFPSPLEWPDQLDGLDKIVR
jgi:hypothetical protein